MFACILEKNVWAVNSRGELKEPVKGTAKRRGLSLHIVVSLLKAWHVLPPHFLLHVYMTFCVKLGFVLGKDLQVSKTRIAVTPVCAQ